MPDALSNAGKTLFHLICNYSTYLILMQSAAKGPDTGEGEVGLIELTRCVWWNVFCRQKAVEQSAEGLNRKRNKAVVICWDTRLISKWRVGVFFFIWYLHHRVFGYRNDGLESVPHLLHTTRDILFKQYGEVSPFRLVLSLVNPACNVPGQDENLNHWEALQFLILCNCKVCDSRVPAQILLVDIKNSSSGHSCRGGCLKVADFKHQPHGGGERHAFITGQSQDLGSVK